MTGPEETRLDTKGVISTKHTGDGDSVVQKHTHVSHMYCQKETPVKKRVPHPTYLTGTLIRVEPRKM
jgi:hypothetical protein